MQVDFTNQGAKTVACKRNRDFQVFPQTGGLRRLVHSRDRANVIAGMVSFPSHSNPSAQAPPCIMGGTRKGRTHLLLGHWEGLLTLLSFLFTEIFSQKCFQSRSFEVVPMTSRT